MKTGMMHVLRDGPKRLYRFSGDHVQIVGALDKQPDPAFKTRETIIVRTRRGDLARLVRLGERHWQRDAELVADASHSNCLACGAPIKRYNSYCLACAK